MKIVNVSLETVCGITSTLPDNNLLEIAFAGRSNVGKSSLINGLMNRKKLAKTSSTPGKTQTINFYNIDESFYLVDLPGYGYTKTAVAVKEKWAKMIDKYLQTSKMLTAIFLLIDIRHDPTKLDIQMFDYIKACGMKPIIIATKQDKLKRSQVASHIKNIKKVLKDMSLEVYPYSAVTKSGREEIYIYLDRILSGELCE